MHGSIIHIRDEGWKELKIGCVFEVEVRPTRDRETGDWEDVAHAVNNSYRAHLGNPEHFGEAVWAEARQRGWERSIYTQVIADTAHWSRTCRKTPFRARSAPFDRLRMLVSGRKSAQIAATDDCPRTEMRPERWAPVLTPAPPRSAAADSINPIPAQCPFG